MTETPADMLPKKERLGTADAHGTYHPGWGWTMNTPLAESKQIASHLGGIRNGLVVSWPAGIAARGEMREQFTHVIDVAPTILDLLGLTVPASLDGVAQQPLEGTSFAYTFANAQAANRHTEQYFEMLGNRGLYQQGWRASTIPDRPPFGDTSGIDPMSFEWALYDLDRDWSQSKDIFDDHPERLEALRARFEECATTYGLHPMGNDQVNRMNDTSLRPSPLSGTGPRAYPAGDKRYRGGAFPKVAAGWRCKASLRVDDTLASGPILSLGSRFAGIRMYVQEGKPHFVVDPTGEEKDKRCVMSDNRLSLGDHEIEVVFTSSFPSIMTMTVDGTIAATARVEVFPVIMTPETYIGRSMIDAVPETANFTLLRLVVWDAGAAGLETGRS